MVCDVIFECQGKAMLIHIRERKPKYSQYLQEMSTTCGTQTCFCLISQSFAVLPHLATQCHRLFRPTQAILVSARRDTIAVRRKHENLC